jgi:hypothetical protein
MVTGLWGGYITKVTMIRQRDIDASSDRQSYILFQ